MGELDRLRILQQIEAEELERQKTLAKEENEPSSGMEEASAISTKDPDSTLRRRKVKKRKRKRRSKDTGSGSEYEDSEDSPFGPNSMIKQPLSNVDRYTMQGGQIL
ncbi:hypothetical protein Ciccas_013248 [Cichlidogyrus casuarinus]|uniref:Uncharacterized protein n=1 Tax=Cichlidogyrus casuarinus TaxID=1844966 RepID=A0ABD2PMJ1_9PLAT